ncbi:hypothetical protein Plhal304r1_c055g0139931 [Plasmopara halstedii]
MSRVFTWLQSSVVVSTGFRVLIFQQVIRYYFRVGITSHEVCRLLTPRILGLWNYGKPDIFKTIIQLRTTYSFENAEINAAIVL